jgi:hypothetical protein
MQLQFLIDFIQIGAGHLRNFFLTLLRKIFFAFAQTIYKPFAQSFIRYSILKSLCLPLQFAR